MCEGIQNPDSPRYSCDCHRTRTGHAIETEDCTCYCHDPGVGLDYLRLVESGEWYTVSATSAKYRRVHVRATWECPEGCQMERWDGGEGGCFEDGQVYPDGWVAGRGEEEPPDFDDWRAEHGY